MSGAAQPTARRLRRPSWSDSRLLVGVLLIVASVALGATVVAGARRTTPVLMATAHLVPGQPVAAGQLTSVQVNLGETTPRYLPGDRPLPAGAVVLREVRAGELVTTDAVGEQRLSRLKPVMVPVEAESAGVLVAGSAVDVWVNRRVAGATSERYGVPTLVLTGATVSRGPERGVGALGATRSTSGVQVMVPTDSVADLIAAVDQGAKVTLVPGPGSVQRGAG